MIYASNNRYVACKALYEYHSTMKGLPLMLFLRSSAMLQGVDLGPLQGIPYGLKDLISVKGYRTTWGAPAYMEQMLDTDAYVYKRCGSILPLSFRSLLLHLFICRISCVVHLPTSIYAAGVGSQKCHPAASGPSLCLT